MREFSGGILFFCEPVIVCKSSTPCVTSEAAAGRDAPLQQQAAAGAGR